eukprot:XP_001689840.1 predicted protein [Chlamydomonas reinhardtii]
MLLLLLQVPRCRAATLMAYMHNDHLSSCAWVPLVQLAHADILKCPARIRQDDGTFERFVDVFMQIDTSKLGTFTFNELAFYMGVLPTGYYQYSDDEDEDEDFDSGDEQDLDPEERAGRQAELDAELDAPDDEGEGGGGGPGGGEASGYTGDSAGGRQTTEGGVMLDSGARRKLTNEGEAM